MRKWNEILESFRQRAKDVDKDYTNVLKYDILPIQVMNAQLRGNYGYERLHFIVKNMLRASYNQDNGKFEPLLTCGVYEDRYGVK